MSDTKIEDVYEAYQEHYHIDDTKKIDLTIATALSQATSGKPIWLLLVGASGIGKNMLTEPLKHVEIDGEPIAYALSDLTANTIVSGQPGKEGDLVPKIDGKIMYIPDFSTVVEKRAERQRKIFAQLRNLYDGFAKKDTGMILDGVEYKEVHTTCIGNVTEAIYRKSLVHQSMGTRFLFYRIEEFEAKQVEKRIREDKNIDENEKAQEIGDVIQSLLETKDLQAHEIPDSVWQEIVKIAKWTAKMRASGKFDSYSNTLEQDITPEKHTRILKQLKKTYLHLQLLRPDYPDERALEILRHIARSCVDPTKIQIFNELAASQFPLEHTELQDRLKIGYRTVQRRLWEMFNVGIIERTDDLGMRKDMSKLDKNSDEHGWRVKPGFQELGK